MKRSDLKVGEHYAYNRGPSSYNTAVEVELLSAEDHWGTADGLVPIPEGRHRHRRGSATLLVIRRGQDWRDSSPFLCSARELVSTWAEEAERAAAEAQAKAAAADRERQRREAFTPTGNLLADRLVAAGCGEDSHLVRQLRAGVREIRVEVSTATLCRLLGVEVPS